MVIAKGTVITCDDDLDEAVLEIDLRFREIEYSRDFPLDFLPEREVPERLLEALVEGDLPLAAVLAGLEIAVREALAQKPRLGGFPGALFGLGLGLFGLGFLF